jgi:phosphatidylinositol alpha-1,6-mannosyltransferase
MPVSGPILFVTRNFPPTLGGIETMAFEIVRHGVAQGEPFVVLHVGQTGPGHGLQGLRLYRRVPGTGRWSALLASFFWVPWMTWRHRPRLIVNMQVTTAPGSWLASRLLGVPYIVICLGLEVLSVRRGPWRALRGLALRGAEKTLSISRFTDSLVARFGVPESARRVLLPGTRTFTAAETAGDRETLFGPGSKEAFVCLSLSRLVPRKGIDMAIAAIGIIAADRPEILYCIGGSGPDLPRLKALVAEKGLEKHVRFLGRVADANLGACYARADLFVLPSRASTHPPDAEGFGIVFLEAGICGTPAVAGASGGIPDAVVEGETGFLVDPEDPQALAGKILYLMDHRADLARMGERARARALELTWDKACQRYLEAMRPAGR